MNKHFLVAAAPAVLAIAACSSPNVQDARAFAPVVLVQSHRAPENIANCLQDRLAGVRTHVGNGTTELSVGHGPENDAWLITLTPSNSGYGSVVKVQKSPDSDGPVPEPEMRFAIARCTT